MPLFTKLKTKFLIFSFILIQILVVLGFLLMNILLKYRKLKILFKL